MRRFSTGSELFPVKGPEHKYFRFWWSLLKLLSSALVVQNKPSRIPDWMGVLCCNKAYLQEHAGYKLWGTSLADCNISPYHPYQQPGSHPTVVSQTASQDFSQGIWCPVSPFPAIGAKSLPQPGTQACVVCPLPSHFPLSQWDYSWQLSGFPPCWFPVLVLTTSWRLFLQLQPTLSSEYINSIRSSVFILWIRICALFSND